MLLHDLLLRLRSLMRHSATENELDDELRFHLERQTRQICEVRNERSRGRASRPAGVRPSRSGPG